MFGPLECPQKVIIMLVYLVLACPGSKNLQSKSNPQWLGGFEKETLKAEGIAAKSCSMKRPASRMSKSEEFKCCARTGVQNYRQNIFWGNERTVLFQDILEKVCIFGALPPRPHLPIQGSCLVLFERKLWKEKGTREARSKNPRSAIQSSFLKVSKRKLWQDKCFLNSGTQDLPSKYQSRERCARTGAQDCR